MSIDFVQSGFGLNPIPLVFPVNNTDTTLRAPLKQIEIDSPYKIYNLLYFLLLRGDL